MAEEEEVRQEFVAEAEDYIRPLDEMAEAAGHFRDEAGTAGQAARELGDQVSELGDRAGDTTGELAALSGSLDDAAGSAEGFAEGEHSARDAITETNHELHDQAESFFALAFAEEAAGTAMDDYRARLDAGQLSARGLHASLVALQDEMGGMGLGETVQATKVGMNEFRVEMGETAAAEETVSDRAKSMRDSLAEAGAAAKAAKDEITRMGLDTDEQAFVSSRALAKERDKLVELAVAAGFAKDKMAELAGVQAAGGFLSLEGGGGKILGFLSDFGSMGSLAGGIGAAIGLTGLITEIGGLVAGFSAAAVGAGAFAALAAPALGKVKDAYTGIEQAQTAYRQAVETEKLDPTSSNAAAVALALAKLKESWMGLDPAERGALENFRALSAEYHKLVIAFEPDAFRVFDNGLKLARELLPHIRPLADDAAKGIDEVLREAEKFADSKGFKDWLKQFGPEIAPSIKAIGGAIGNFVGDWGKFVTSFSPKDIANAFHILDNVVNWTMTGLTRWSHNVMNMWDDFSAAAKNVRNWYRDAMDGISADTVKAGGVILRVTGDAERDWETFRYFLSMALDQAREDVVGWGHDVEHDWDSAWSAVISYAEGVPGRIERAFSDLPGLLVHLGAELIHGLIGGIESEIPGLSSILGTIHGWLSDLNPGNWFSDIEHAVGLGPGPRPRPSPSASAAMLAGPGPGGTTHIHNTTVLNVGGSLIHEQQLSRVMRDRQNDHTFLNASAGLTLPGRGRAL